MTSGDAPTRDGSGGTPSPAARLLAQARTTRAGEVGRRRRVLVTGSEGAVGTHLVAELRARGHEVWSLDRVHSNDPRYIRADVGEFRQFQQAIEIARPDLVYHLAAEFGRWNGEDFYETLWRSNVVGNKHLIRVQEEAGFRVIFFSSSEVYGDWRGVMSEDVMDMHEIRQLTDYAMTKWVGELQHLNAQAMSGTETVRVRLFNVYGPGEYYSPYRSALSIFLYKALFHEPFTVNASHTRSWLYVTDCVWTLANIADNFVSGEVYNLGERTQLGMGELAEIVKRLAELPEGLIAYRQAEPFTTRDKAVDISKAERDLDHRPEMSLEQGIVLTLQWMRGVYGAKSLPIAAPNAAR